MREVHRTWSDRERAGRELGYQAGVGLVEGISVQVGWAPEEGFAHSLMERGSVYERFNLIDRRQEVEEQAGRCGLDLRLL
jgi:hypothetical protein